MRQPGEGLALAGRLDEKLKEVPRVPETPEPARVLGARGQGRRYASDRRAIAYATHTPDPPAPR